LESSPTKTVWSREPIDLSYEARSVTMISQDAITEAPDHAKKSGSGVQNRAHGIDNVELLLTY